MCMSSDQGCRLSRHKALWLSFQGFTANWRIKGLTNWYPPVKTVSDIVLTLVLLLVTAPVIFLAALLVKLSSPGPAFYSQVRLGRGGKPFSIYKIRTMTHNCEKLTGVRWSTPGDARVTRVGWFLRRLHIDELPQLWNILRGEMSLVGPRPERPEFVVQLETAIPRYRERLLVRPGLTGLAQLQLPPDTDLQSVKRKLAYDLFYLERLGPVLDLRLLFGTAFYLLKIPPHYLRILLGVPTLEQVEQAYEKLAADRPSLVSPLQPA